MCTTTFDTLTFASMLSDPLIQAMMASDGVSKREHAALLFRVKDRLADRAPWRQPELELPERDLSELVLAEV